MTVTKKPAPFQIIRHRGQLNEGQLPDGFKVYRQEKIWFDDQNAFVTCASYDDHFLYLAPKSYPGSSFRCTCGSPAVLVGPQGYLHDASPQGKILVCLLHAQTGLHATGGSRWV